MSDCASPPADKTTFDHDPNGNLTDDGLRTYTWDLENRPHTITLGSTTNTYSYDGDGNRLIADNGITHPARYLWDTNAGLPQLAMERDATTGDLLRRYVHASSPVSMRTNGSDYYYSTDALGSVVNVTDPTGQDELNYLYDPFGGARAAQGGDPNAPTNLIRFAGELDDQSTFLYDLRARMYDPESGRMLQRDPFGGAIGSPAVSSYAYANNRPGVLVDPSGASSILSTLKEMVTHPVASYNAGLEQLSPDLYALQQTVVHVAPLGLALLSGVGDIGFAAEGLGAESAVNSARLAEQLRFEEASSIFTDSGGLKEEVIAASEEIVSGERLGNPSVIKALTADGSGIGSWSKFRTPTFQSPSGPFQVHFYYNEGQGIANYAWDYKATFVGPRP